MAGELTAIRLAIELGPEARELASAGVRFVEELMLPSAGRSAVQVAKSTGIVAKDMEFPLVNDVEALQGNVRFGADGSAQINDLVTQKTMSYRKTDDLFFLYDSSRDPAAMSATFRRGYLGNPGASAFTPLDRSKQLVAHIGAESSHDWNRLTAKQFAAVKDAVPEGSDPVGLGSKRQAWFTPKDDQVVVLGPTYKRPPVPNLLQPSRKELIGDKQLEWFPLGESDSITRADVKDINHQIRMSGWHADDSFTANYVRLADGKVWRVDPEDLFPMSPKSWKEYLDKHR